MEKSSTIDIQKIDNEGEYLLTTIREGIEPVDISTKIKAFVDQNLENCGIMIQRLDFKNCYYVFKKVEKVLIQILKVMQDYSCKVLPISEILLSLIEHPDSPEKFDLKPFMMCPIELYRQELEIDSKTADLMDFIIKKAIICANNCGVIYMMRSKCSMALSHIFRGALSRFQFLNDYNSIFQQAILMLNSAFCFKNLEKYEEAGQLINKGIIILEYIEKVLGDHGGVYNNFMEKGTVMLTLQEFLFNKSENSFQEASENDSERLIYLLSVSYKYYGEILQKQKRNKEADFCYDNSKTLYKKFKQTIEKQQKFKKSQTQFNQSMRNKAGSGSYNSSLSNSSNNSKLTKNLIQSTFPKKENRGSQNYNNQEDNFSHASFKTINTTTTNFTNLGSTRSYVTKDNIIFQKYVTVNETRYKAIIVQIKEHNCIQILLYNKPENFLKKLIVGFQALIDHGQQNGQNPFESQESVNMFFKDIIRKLQLSNGELKIRDIEYFQSVEEFSKVNRLSKIGAQQSSQRSFGLGNSGTYNNSNLGNPKIGTTPGRPILKNIRQQQQQQPNKKL